MGVGAMWGATKLHAMSMSSATSVAVLVSLARRYSICTVSPGASLRASSISLCPGPDSSSSSDFTPASPVPLNFVMMSPAFSPAFPGRPAGGPGSELGAGFVGLGRGAGPAPHADPAAVVAVREGPGARLPRGAGGGGGGGGGGGPRWLLRREPRWTDECDG